MTFPFFLSLEAKGFQQVGGEDGVVTQGALVCCLAGVVVDLDITIEGDSIVFDG